MRDFSAERDEVLQHFQEGFEHDLVQAAFDNLNFPSKLRPSNFGYALRHVLDVFLKRIAPTDRVVAAAWYENYHREPVENPGYISHKQRMHYGLCKGLLLTHEAIVDLELDELLKEFRGKRDKLNHLTHLRAGYFNLDAREQDDLVAEIVDTLLNYLDSFEDVIREVEESVEGSVADEVFGEYVTGYDDQLSIISNSYEIGYVDVDKKKLLRIDEDEVTFMVSGEVSVTQNLGPSRDSVSVSGDYPFFCEISFSCAGERWGRGEISNLTTDTDSWFGIDDDDSGEEEIAHD